MNPNEQKNREPTSEQMEQIKKGIEIKGNEAKKQDQVNMSTPNEIKDIEKAEPEFKGTSKDFVFQGIIEGISDSGIVGTLTQMLLNHFANNSKPPIRVKLKGVKKEVN